jgi:hypothetical protein
VELIRTAYTSADWPGKAELTPATAVIIVSGAVPLSARLLISNGHNSITGASGATPLPPIALRGAGPNSVGIIEGASNSRILDISNGAHVIMENYLVLRGSATGPSASDLYGNGGAVHIGANSFFTMTGGTISASAPQGFGGAVYAYPNSTFLMKGGTITKNDAKRGAGVCVFNATFTMSGGSIEDNGTTPDTEYAGGLYIITHIDSALQASSSMSGGTITGNKAKEGGGIVIENSVLTIDGGTIAGNQAVVDGGGIQIEWSAKVIINNGVISGNTAGASGGGIMLDRRTSNLTINGGAITGNTAGQMGGGVYVSMVNGGTPSFTMTGGTLAENQAGTSGGGVCIEDGGVFTKQPLTPNASSGVIYGYSADNSSSNFVKSSFGYEEDKGHAVYVENGPKKRETTVGPDQHLDATGGWAE